MSNSSDIEEIFRPRPSGKTLVITVGNPYRSDDGVGPFIAANVTNPRNHILILDAGERPESVVFKAIELKPGRTIIIDAADFGGAPGEVRIIPESAVPDVIHSTHNFPLTVVSRMISDDTGAEVFFVGIQYENMSYGEVLTSEVRASAEKLIGMISVQPSAGNT